MKKSMEDELANVHVKLVDAFLRWEPGHDDLGLASTVYKIVHKFILFILGVEFQNSGTAS